MPRLSKAERERRRRADEHALMRRLTDAEFVAAFEYVQQSRHYPEDAMRELSELLNHNVKGTGFLATEVRRIREELHQQGVIDLSTAVPYVKTAADLADDKRIIAELVDENYRTGDDATVFASKLLAAADAGMPLGLLWEGDTEPDTNWSRESLDGLAILDSPGEAAAVVRAGDMWIPITDWTLK